MFSLGFHPVHSGEALSELLLGLLRHFRVISQLLLGLSLSLFTAIAPRRTMLLISISATIRSSF